MKAETWARVRELFEAATRLEPEERDAWLAERCSSAPEVLAEVERLLAEDRTATGFLESPPFPSLALPGGETNGAGTRVGRYTLVRVLASGGMGTVWEALQDQPQRTVALKMLRTGPVTASRLRRFRYEIEVLGALTHPGIARIFEAGTYEGAPYFAMEFVHGARDLLAYAREERLTLAERVRLFADVCDAVSHGHQKGVIHRDLKPSNLLVGADGQPKVIDFGVARATGQGLEAASVETRAGQIVGTLQYMSPEQLAGKDVDVRSDVYALGCVLYELLTGTLPYDVDGLTIAALAQRIAEAEPRRPAGLPADLGWILMHALEKPPERRYASASELRADLERFLRHEPVLAGPPSKIWLVRKLVRRNRAVLTGFALVLAGLSFGLVRARIDARAAEVAQANAEREAAKAERETANAEREAANAEREAAKARGVSAFLRRILTSVAPHEMGDDVKVVDVLDEAARTARDDLAATPDVRAIVEQVIGESYLALGRFAEAEEHLSFARAVFERTGGEDDPYTLETLASFAYLLLDQQRLAAVDELTRDLLPRVESRLGREHACAVRVRRTRTLALAQLDRYTEADALAVENLAIERARGERPESLIRLLGDHAKVRSSQGRFEEQLTLLEEALAVCDRELPPDHFLTQTTRMSLGRAYFELTRWEDSEGCFRACLAWFERELGPEHDQTLAALNNLSISLTMQRRTDEAYDLIIRAAELAKKLHGEKSISALNTLVNLAGNFVMREEFEDAESVCLEALDVSEGLLPSDHDLVLRLRMSLGRAVEALGRLDEALEIFRFNYERSRANLGRDHPVTLSHLSRLVYVHVLREEHAEVERWATELLEQGRPSGRFVEWSTEKLAEARAALGAGN